MLRLKFCFIFIFLVLLSFIIYSSDLFYLVVENSDIYKIESSTRAIGRIKQGEKCKALNDAALLDVGLRIKIEYNGLKGWVNAEKLKPLKSKDLGKEITLEDKSFHWTMSYFLKVIKEQNIQMVVQYDPFWLTEIPENSSDYLEEFSIPNILFNNSVIVIYDAYFLVRKIKYLNSFYYIDVKLIRKEEYFNKKLDMLNDFSSELLTLVLKIDGDYMDIYINDERTKLIELIKVDKNFVDSLYKVVKQESVDLSKINWPQRADKEQPEEDTTTKASKKNYYTPTVNNLRFRATPTIDGRFIRHLKAGEQLELIERGKSETIGDVKGTWVKVKTKQGEVGWCFDAYLKEVK